METIENKELVKRIKKEIKSEDLEINLVHLLGCINDWVDDNNWMVKYPTKYPVDFDFDEIELHFNNNASKSSRKKLAKKIARVWQKPSRRTINTLLFVLKKQGIIREVIKVEPSRKHQQIQEKRKAWKELRDKADKALKAYKKEKGDFYKKKLAS